MNARFSILILLICATDISWGQEMPATEAGRLALQNRSTFTPDRSTTRNPCWPIGWVPAATSQTPAQVAAVPQEAPRIPPQSINVQSILLGSPPIAIINGKEVSIGSRIMVNVGGSQQELVVLRIRDGYVDFDHRGTLVRARKPD